MNFSGPQSLSIACTSGVTSRKGAVDPAMTTLSRPKRLFTKPLARALIEQRRILALDANRNTDVFEAIDALMIAPELFMADETGHYLGLYSVARELEAFTLDDALPHRETEVVRVDCEGRLLLRCERPHHVRVAGDRVEVEVASLDAAAPRPEGMQCL